MKIKVVKSLKSIRHGCKICTYSVDSRLKIVHSQKKQNDHLKTELKVLNSSLNNVIDRMGNKPYP